MRCVVTESAVFSQRQQWIVRGANWVALVAIFDGSYEGLVYAPLLVAPLYHVSFRCHALRQPHETRLAVALREVQYNEFHCRGETSPE